MAVSQIRLASNVPSDPEGQNGERSLWANAAVVAFKAVTGLGDKDALCHLLCDLRHWADRNGLDFERELAAANSHYQDEITDPNEEAA